MCTKYSNQFYSKLSAAQSTFPTTPIPIPDIDTDELLACINEGVEQLEIDADVVIDWALNLYETVDRLVEQRRRCLEMTNDRLQQACMATWTAQTIFEANRLRNDLAFLTNEETAEIFRYHFLECFQIDPEHPEYHRKR